MCFAGYQDNFLWMEPGGYPQDVAHHKVDNLYDLNTGGAGVWPKKHHLAARFQNPMEFLKQSLDLHFVEMLHHPQIEHTVKTTGFEGQLEEVSLFQTMDRRVVSSIEPQSLDGYINSRNLVDLVQIHISLP